MTWHAITYTGSVPCGRCPAQACGGIIPDSDCPDHGDSRNPAMEWHQADGERCRNLAAARPR